MNKVSRIGLALVALFLTESGHAQSNMYIGPTSSMYTFPGSQITVFGNLINDAQGGLNHANGGTVYLYRSAANGTGNSRIMDGPLSPTATDDYNSGGSYIRVYNLITNNTVGTAVPSGTVVNTTAGSGQIQIEQEVRITDNHDFLNGMVWTPRAQWKHAFLHYEDTATYTGVAASNTVGTHVDGYVAYSGTHDFMFPVGDGIMPRMSGVVVPGVGEYRSAYFHANPQSGTPGISGTSAGPFVPGANILQAVSQSEFWDIDGTGSTNIALTAANTAATYSNWATDFASFPLDSGYNVSIAGWDAWENLGMITQPATFGDDGVFVSTQSVTPDLGGLGGNPYSVFTWASANNNSLGITDLMLSLREVDCHAMLSFSTMNEKDMSHADIFRAMSGGSFEKIATVALIGESTGRTDYHYEDVNVALGHEYIYRVEAVDIAGHREVSEQKLFQASCDQETSWTLYPNPSSGMIHIATNYAGQIGNVQVYDAIGRIVFQDDYSTTEPAGNFAVDIDLTPYSRGVYHISLHDAIGQEVHSFMVSILQD